MGNVPDVVAAVMKKSGVDAEHHGVKGQRWGVRRTQAQLDAAAASRSEDAAKVDASKAKIKAAGGTHALSNQELQQLVTRMNLEQQFTRLSTQSKTTNAGAKFVKDMLINIGKQQITKIAQDQIGKQVQAAMNK